MGVDSEVSKVVLEGLQETEQCNVSPVLRHGKKDLSSCFDNVKPLKEPMCKSH